MAKFFVDRPDRRHGDRDHHGHRGAGDDRRATHRAIPQNRPPEIYIHATYVGADAQTIEQSVATPIEQEMSGVDNMNYMYSVNANNGDEAVRELRSHHRPQHRPRADPDAQRQAESKVPADVRNYGITVKKSHSAPLMIVDAAPPHGTPRRGLPGQLRLHQPESTAHPHAGDRRCTVFGAGQYAMRSWVKPDQLAKLNITVPDIMNAISSRTR